MSYISWARHRFHGLLAGILRHPIITLLAATLVTGLAIGATSRLTIQSNFADLLPSDDPVVKELHQLEQVVGGASFVVLTAEGDQPEIVPPLFDAVAARLADHPEVRYLDYRPPGDFFRRTALLYLPVDDLRDLVERVRERIARAKLKDFAVDLAEPDEEPFSLAELEAKYPLHLPQQDFYQSKDGRLFVMLIKPHGRATDVIFSRRFLSDVQAAISGARSELASLEPSVNEIQVRLTGPYVKALSQNEIVMADAKRISGISLLGMLAVIYLYFRRKRAAILIGLPLAASVVWTMGTAALWFGTLNFFTATATAVLLGLSTDYGIHLYSRYLAYRHDGASPAEAMQQTYTHLGTAMWAAAITTIAGFLSLTLSSFTAFYQFGWIIALGMVYCVIAMTTVFPALTVLFARYRPEEETETPTRLFYASLVARLHRLVTKPAVFGIASVLCVLALIPIVRGGVRFDYNFSNIMGAQPTRELDERVDQIFTQTVNPEVARAASAEDAAAFAAAVRAAKASPSDGERSTISTAVALADFVPAEQEIKTPLVGTLQGLFTETVLNGLTGEEQSAYQRMLPALSPPHVTAADLPASILAKFEDLHGERGKFLFVFPAFDPANGREFFRFVEELRAVQCPACSQPVTISGESATFYEIVHRMFQDGRWVIGVSLLAIWFALWVAFRRLTDAAQCFLPFCVGIVVMLGVMGACGIPFTLISIAVVPILLGIAIDYPIYFYQQRRHFGPGRSATTYQMVVPPIFGSALTTIIGFGSLMLAQNLGARSFGLAAVIGLGSCLLATIGWFPRWLQLMERHASADGRQHTTERATASARS
ncbi:MAG: MMPL family transporter [Deltaproteobacteria bacterium]|nr:MMPL family transporter [Deltaproteobacteria bacterium]